MDKVIEGGHEGSGKVLSLTFHANEKAILSGISALLSSEGSIDLDNIFQTPYGEMLSVSSKGSIALVLYVHYTMLASVNSVAPVTFQDFSERVTSKIVNQIAAYVRESHSSNPDAGKIDLTENELMPFLQEAFSLTCAELVGVEVQR